MSILNPKNFYYFTTIDDDAKKAHPGLLTGTYWHSDQFKSHEFAIFVDPRRTGHTFVDKTGIVPIVRLDLSLADDLLEGETDPIGRVLEIAFQGIKDDLEYYEGKGEIS